MYVCMYVCMYVYVCIYVYMCECVPVCVCVCMYVCVCIYVCTYEYVPVCLNVCQCLCVSVADLWGGGGLGIEPPIHFARYIRNLPYVPLGRPMDFWDPPLVFVAVSLFRMFEM